MNKSDLNKVIIKETVRPNGSLRIQQDFSNCPSLAEQHTAHLTNLNYLIEKYRPDELAAFMAARDSYRREIIGHDFSQEPDLQESKNHVYILRKNFLELPDEIKNNFKNAVEFYKFIENPANQEKMIRLGLLSQQEVTKLTSDPKADDVGGQPSVASSSTSPS